jgi:hypothetical protein
MTKAQHARGPYPLSVQPAGERFNVITNQGNFYAMTYDPAVAALIVAAAETTAERDGLKTEVDHLRQTNGKCRTCDGHGMIGGFVGSIGSGGEGYDVEPCPDCAPTTNGGKS